MKEYFIESVLERVNPKKLYFYHLVPKKANISKGLLAPYAMNKFGMEKELSFSLDKYRNRLVDTDAWNIYPNRDPKSLSNEEILNGINQFRKSEDGSKYIYFFRYPPYKELGKHMENILREKDIYRINLNDKELQKNILDISWGWIGSNTDNQAVNKKWYETIKPEKYFAGYNDNPKNGTPLFAPLVHIGIAFKDGICPRKFLTKVKENMRSELATESNYPDSNSYETKTKIEIECEVKNSYHTLNGAQKDPIPQLILHKNGKNYRVRSEILVFQDDKVLLRKKNKVTQYGTTYVIPGGGIDDPDECIEVAAARECNEEAKVVVSNVKYSGEIETGLYGKKIPKWHKKTLWLDGIKYDGYWTYICTGIYSKKYTKYVKKVDSQADIANQSHWYTFDEVKDILTPKHRKLFKEYLSTHGIL